MNVMRTLVAARALVVTLGILLVSATAARAQQPAAIDATPMTPVIVQSLDDPRDPHYTIGAVTATLAGAAGGALMINMVTGGAALAPVVGIPISDILGGAWLAAVAVAPLAGEPVVHTISVAVIAFGGGLFGHFMSSDR